MNSSLKEVNDFRSLLNRKLLKAKEKLDNLEKSLKERYPEDMYGIKWMRLASSQKEKIEKEITLYHTYLKACNDLISTVEVDILHIQEEE